MSQKITECLLNEVFLRKAYGRTIDAGMLALFREIGRDFLAISFLIANYGVALKEHRAYRARAATIDAMLKDVC